eukprot:8316094-Ditylum_brightwellii.AAC.1
MALDKKHEELKLLKSINESLAETRTRKKAKRHDCPKNHDGSSKAIESAAALILTVKMYDEEIVLVEAIVADDDSSMKSVVGHSFQEKEARKD